MSEMGSEGLSGHDIAEFTMGLLNEEPAAAEEAPAEGQPRDELGRFAETPAAEAPAEETPAETPEGEQPAEVAAEEPEDQVIELDIEDADVAAFLEKYDGDLVKALQAATHASKLVGKRDEDALEARALREELAALRQRLESPVPTLPHPTSLVNKIDEDPEAAARLAAQVLLGWDGDQAQATPYVEVFVQALTVWKEDDPFGAATLASNVQNEINLRQLRQEFAARQSAPAQDTDADVNREVGAVLQRHPDFEKYVAGIGAVLNESPWMKQVVQHGTAVEKAKALEDAYLIARSREPDTSADAIKRVVVRQKAEAEAARAEAAVISASRGSAASGGQPTRVDQFLDAFDSHLTQRGLMGHDGS